MRGDLTLVGGPADGQVVKHVEAGVCFVNVPVMGDNDVVYQVIEFLSGPNPFCNARFAVPEGMTMYEGIALLAANYSPDKQ